MESECCGAPPLLNTDVHDGIAICDSCREWSGFYDEDDIETVKEEGLNEPTTADEFNRNPDDCMITYHDPGDENDNNK